MTCTSVTAVSRMMLYMSTDHAAGSPFTTARELNKLHTLEQGCSVGAVAVEQVRLLIVALCSDAGHLMPREHLKSFTLRLLQDALNLTAYSAQVRSLTSVKVITIPIC